MRNVAIILIALVVLVSGRGTGQSFRTEESVLLAFGDVNLGRHVGQQIFAGDTTYPFRKIMDLMAHGDLRFANLESPLTDQGGETRHPRDPYRFCGPRSGAVSMKRAQLDIVSGANNHAYDYGRRGVAETVSALADQGIQLVGLRDDPDNPYPRILTAPNGIRIGFVAYAEFVNVKGTWKKSIPIFERSLISRDIRWLRERADVVVASYHGGTEYTPTPPRGSLRNLRYLADAGADVVLGHHPHVPQGVEVRDASIIFYSLGNFVFYQPQRFWTQIGLAACLHISRSRQAEISTDMHVLPFRAGLQPIKALDPSALDSLALRFQTSSPTPLRRVGSSFVREDNDHTHF